MLAELQDPEVHVDFADRVFLWGDETTNKVTELLAIDRSEVTSCKSCMIFITKFTKDTCPFCDRFAKKHCASQLCSLYLSWVKA